jgi:hypothetical protein
VSGTTPWLLDVNTGQPAHKVDGSVPPGATGTLSVSPDCRKLACLTENRLLVWDVAVAPPAVSDVSFEGANNGTFDWLSPGYAMIGGRYCADLAHQLLFWDYATEENGVAGSCGGEYWYSTTAAGKRVLAHLPLPHDAALQAAAKIDPATVMAIQPGAKVSIDLSAMDATDLLKSRAVAALTTKLQANGLEVWENQPTRLVVTSVAGEAKEITYRGATEASTTTVSLPEDLVTVSFVVDGKTAWQTTRPATPPGTLALRPGQSAEEFLAAERARLRLAAATNVTLPKFVPRPRESKFFGRSVLTEAGPKPAE